MKGKMSKLEAVANSVATFISGTAFVAIVFFTSINVICRYFFHYSINWAEEITYLAFNWAVFFGTAVVYRYQGLTAIDVLVNRLPAKSKKAVLIFDHSLLLAINVSLIVWGFTFAMNAWIRKSPILGVPYFFFDVSIPLAAIIMAGYSLKFLIKTIKNEELEEAALEERS